MSIRKSADINSLGGCRDHSPSFLFDSFTPYLGLLTLCFKKQHSLPCFSGLRGGCSQGDVFTGNFLFTTEVVYCMSSVQARHKQSTLSVSLVNCCLFPHVIFFFLHSVKGKVLQVFCSSWFISSWASFLFVWERENESLFLHAVVISHSGRVITLNVQKAEKFRKIKARGRHFKRFWC